MSNNIAATRDKCNHTHTCTHTRKCFLSSGSPVRWTNFSRKKSCHASWLYNLHQHETQQNIT